MEKQKGFVQEELTVRRKKGFRFGHKYGGEREKKDDTEL
jgi:hypothetical protein